MFLDFNLNFLKTPLPTGSGKVDFLPTGSLVNCFKYPGILPSGVVFVWDEVDGVPCFRDGKVMKVEDWAIKNGHYMK